MKHYRLIAAIFCLMSFQAGPVNASGGFFKDLVNTFKKSDSASKPSEPSPEKSSEVNAEQDQSKLPQIQGGGKPAADSSERTVQRALADAPFRHPAALATADSDEERCNILYQWSSRYDVEGMRPSDGASHGGLLIYGDADFEPVFGMNWEKFLQSERASKRTLWSLLKTNVKRSDIWKLINQECDVPKGKWSEKQLEFVRRGFGGRVDPNVAYTLIDNRRAHDWQKQSLVRMEKISEAQNELSFNQLRDIERALNRGNLALWPSEIKAFQNEIAAYKSKVALALWQPKFELASKQALDFNGVNALLALVKDYDPLFSALDPEKQERAHRKVDGVVNDWLEAEMPLELKKLNGFGRGPSALSAGKQWFHKFTLRYFGPEWNREAVNRVLAEFRKRRVDQLSAATPELVDICNATSTLDGLANIENQYLDGVLDVIPQVLTDCMDTRKVVIAKEVATQKQTEQAAAELKTFSAHEIALMHPGTRLIDVPKNYGKPTQDDVQVAVLRAIAYLKTIQSSYLTPFLAIATHRPGETDMQVMSRGLKLSEAKLIDKNRVRTLAGDLIFSDAKVTHCEKDPTEGYRCKFSIHVTEVELSDLSRRTQDKLASLTRGMPLFNGLDMNLSGPSQIALDQESQFTLTEQGWSSPSMIRDIDALAREAAARANEERERGSLESQRRLNEEMMQRSFGW